MDSVNSVVLVGCLERDPTMRFVPASGMPCCVGTLRCDEIGTGGQTFRLYVPLEAYGRTAEALGALTAGALIGGDGAAYQCAAGNGGRGVTNVPKEVSYAPCLHHLHPSRADDN